MHQKYGKIGIANAGGSFNGIYEAIWLQPYFEAGLPLHYFSSASVGAWNGPAIVAEPNLAGAKKTLSIWKKYMTSPKGAYKGDPKLAITGIKKLDPTPLISTLLREVDFQKVIEGIPWDIISYRIEDAREVSFSNKMPGITPHMLIRFICASAALTPWYDIVEIDGYHYKDGDIPNPLAISQGLYDACDTIFVFLPTPEIKHRTVPKHSIDDFIQNYSIESQALIREKIKNYQRRVKEDGKNLFIIRPEARHPEIGLFKISPDAMEYIEPREIKRKRDYFANLDQHNLRFLPLLP